jgi:hypothetical protein
MRHYVPNNKSKNRSKRNPDASWIWSFMVAARVCTHSVHTTEFLILLLLNSEIFLMHRPHQSVFPDVLIIYVGAFTEFGHDAMRNMIGMWTTAPQPCLLLVRDHQIRWFSISSMLSKLCSTHIPLFMCNTCVHTYSQSPKTLLSFPYSFCSANHLWSVLHCCADWLPS